MNSEWDEEEMRCRLSSGGGRFLAWLEGCSLPFQQEIASHMALVEEALQAEPGSSSDLTLLVSLWCKGYHSACYILSVAVGNGFEEVAFMYGVGVGVFAVRLQGAGVGLN